MCAYDLNPGGVSLPQKVSDLAVSLNQQETVIGGGDGSHDPRGRLCILASGAWSSPALSGRKISRGRTQLALPPLWPGKASRPSGARLAGLLLYKKLLTYQG